MSSAPDRRVDDVPHSSVSPGSGTDGSTRAGREQAKAEVRAAKERAEARERARARARARAEAKAKARVEARRKAQAKAAAKQRTAQASARAEAEADARALAPLKPPSTLPEYHSTGRFTRLTTGTRVRGTGGELIRYRVEVEDGSGVAPEDFGRAIDTTLAHPQGWTADGQWRFQRVVRAEPDLTIHLATPDTVDRECAAWGMSTGGYASCRAGDHVWLNLDRWYIGVPHIDDLTVYRQYLVNHEVGHRLGKGHEGCPGAGRSAPVMLQQTGGLQGCTPNPWPRDIVGLPVTGPPLP